MDKESIYELQLIDCNCNDCFFMKRDFDKFKQSQELHYKWQLDWFKLQKRKLIEKAQENKRIGKIQVYDVLMKEANNMKFQFDRNESKINYGFCDKLNKEVSFIPSQCQLDTQNCFKHRLEKENINEK